MSKAPTGFFYDPNGDLTRHKPVKAIWVESVDPKWFWQPETFMVRLDYEDGEGWKWERFDSFGEAASFRDELIETMKADSTASA